MSSLIPTHLAPRYATSLVLSGQAGAVEIVSPELVLALAGATMLRGQDATTGALALDDVFGVFTIDLSLRKRLYTLTLTGDSTLEAEGGTLLGNGDPFAVHVIQGGAGGHALTIGAGFLFGDDLTVVPLSTIAGKRDAIAMQHVHGLGVLVLGYTRGFST